MLTITLLILAALTAVAFSFFPHIGWVVAGVLFLFFLVILQFFRNPARLVPVRGR